MRRLVKAHGPCPIAPKPELTPFQSLVRAIAHQQLNGTAAETILGRFRALFPGRSFPKPDAVLAASETSLRSAGFSRAKVAAIRDLARKTLEGVVPGARAIERLDDEAIVERLTAVRGVGRWTVEMLLIFKLGRADVLPADDFGVRNGFRIAYRLKDLPKPKALREHGERWRPYRSAAAWYLWRAADGLKKT
ncbi:MAG: DNA-3-methyladenine glycosylase 2 family protein [Planctomycetota bacterium]|nr:DNA-3-methyladenine glycosylase 2 family protein [Planctomycetota bacterium]